MGNSLGDIAHACGAADIIGFQTTTRAVINAHGIEPWPARDLVRHNLQRQANLAKNHAFKQIPVADGVRWFKDRVGGYFAHLTRNAFVEQGCALLQQSGVQHGQKDRNELYDIFDAMDFDGNGELSVGEWAGGVTVFFKGNNTECVLAVFDALDTNGDHTLDKNELREYLKPFVNAMTPPEASALRPLLLSRASDVIFDEMDFDHDTRITSDEMLQWSKESGNNVINRVANIIEHEVYSGWLREQGNQQMRGYGNRRPGEYGKGGLQDPRYPRDSYGGKGYGNDSRYPPNDSRYPADAYGGKGYGNDSRYPPTDSYGGKGYGTESRYPDNAYGGKGYDPRSDYNSRPYDSGNGYRDSGHLYDSRVSNNGSGKPRRKPKTSWSDIIPGLDINMTSSRRRDRPPPRSQYVGSSNPRYGGYNYRGNEGDYMTPHHHDSIYGGGY